MNKFIQIPANAVICHYAETPQGVAVVTPSGRVLAKSFYDLRQSHEFYSSINGAGGWVVLVTRPSLFPQIVANQHPLF
jgi:hypothetical protein